MIDLQGPIELLDNKIAVGSKVTINDPGSPDHELVGQIINLRSGIASVKWLNDTMSNVNIKHIKIPEITELEDDGEYSEGGLKKFRDFMESISTENNRELVDSVKKGFKVCFEGVEGLDKFTEGYITAALWSSTDDKGEPFDSNYSINDFAPETLQKMRENSYKFQNDDLNHEALDKYTDVYSSDYAGHDFWLTQNGHGAGFWDRENLPDGIGKKLTEAAKKYPEMNLYVGDDGKIYA
jgi:hypothetical protein